MTLLLPVAGVLGAASLLLAAVGRWAARDRLRLLGSAIGTAAALLVVQRLAPWTPGTAPLWYLAVLVAAVGAALAVRRFRRLPWREPGHRLRGPLALGAEALALVALAALLG